MNYQVKEYYYNDNEQKWELLAILIRTTDLEKAKKAFFKATWNKTEFVSIWVEFALLSIDDLGQITTMIELKKRSNI